MADLPEFVAPSTAFSHRFSVQPGDIDELGHANNVVWVRWVNEVAIAHSRSAGLGPDVYVSLGVVWVVRRHDIEYLIPALPGELVEATTWVANMRGATSQRRTTFRRAGDGVLLSRATTTWALVDMVTGKPRRVPREMMQRYGLAEG